MNLSDLIRGGFDVQSKNHAEAVLARDFPGPLVELCGVLLDFRIRDVELIERGGGEAIFTRRLRRSLTDRNWPKRNIVIRKIVDNDERASISHEIDHVRRSENGAVALEIEWNNKDPFFDRDLENFQRLHGEGAISVGIIVTRGNSLQQNLIQIVETFARRHDVRGIDDLEQFGLNPTVRQRRMIEIYEEDFISVWARLFVRDKFGSATTRWDKLQVRINRGVGNPCPLLLIGMPAASIEQAEIE